MTDPLSTDHERQLLTELVQLVRQCAKGEEEIQTRLANQNVIANEEQTELATSSQSKYQEERQRLEEEYQRARAEAVVRFDGEGATLKKQYADLQREHPQCGRRSARDGQEEAAGNSLGGQHRLRRHEEPARAEAGGLQEARRRAGERDRGNAGDGPARCWRSGGRGNKGQGSGIRGQGLEVRRRSRRR